MRVIFLVVILFCASLSHAQKGRKVALEKTNKEDYKSKIESLKKDPNQALSQSDEVDTKVDTSKKVSAFEKTSRRERKKMDPTTASSGDSKITTSPTNASAGNVNDTSKKISAIANTSAIAHGEARIPNASAAKNYKYKADEKSAEYYTELRKKFEEEDKINKQKDSVLAIENAKKEEEIKQGRRLPEEQAPQFDKYRQGAKNPVVEKTTAEEDYKTIFK
jgi:hypothetical protein